jgi:hypothetical protein
MNIQYLLISVISLIIGILGTCYLKREKQLAHERYDYHRNFGPTSVKSWGLIIILFIISIISLIEGFFNLD